MNEEEMDRELAELIEEEDRESKKAILICDAEVMAADRITEEIFRFGESYRRVRDWEMSRGFRNSVRVFPGTNISTYEMANDIRAAIGRILRLGDEYRKALAESQRLSDDHNARMGH